MTQYQLIERWLDGRITRPTKSSLLQAKIYSLRYPDRNNALLALRYNGMVVAGPVTVRPRRVGGGVVMGSASVSDRHRDMLESLCQRKGIPYRMITTTNKRVGLVKTLAAYFITKLGIDPENRNPTGFDEVMLACARATKGFYAPHVYDTYCYLCNMCGETERFGNVDIFTEWAEACSLLHENV